MLSARKPVAARLRRLGALMAAGALSAATLQAVTPAPASAAGPADHVNYWNGVLLQTFRETNDIGPGPLARSAAIMYVSMYDAANSVLCAQRAVDCLGQPYTLKVGSGGDFNTALDYAAHDALTGVFGPLGFNFDDELATAQTDIPASAQQAAGQSIGQQTAVATLQRRANDHAGDLMTYTPDSEVGAWQPATPTGPVVTPNWGNVTPFVMSSGSQFRPAAPADADTYAEVLASDEYTAQFNEVKAYGAWNSTVRTPDQTKAAFFWANDVNGTYKPPGQLLQHTQIIADGQQVPATVKVKLFAQVATGLADASILAWDRKFLGSVDLWRPDMGIHRAGEDGNADTEPDGDWQPLSIDRQGRRFSPPFPAYVSGHATFAYTWAHVMEHWFGRDNITYTGTTDDPNASGPRTFTSFSAAADENAHSRLWLGVHWHFDADNVLNPGNELGEYVVDNTMYYNRSDTELLYLHKTGVTNRNECDNTGRQLSNEHRWEFYRCVHSNNRTVYDLYVR
ncbi:vanadium-dependent haloperoxidase [Nucisporomicrobium flavum]|uniref:vanadium-dependent haloperoxidase n=1 Tax=Nucisporomicrobium flavum TaxID=2785915 RepID=UPI0018F46615|nr:vanadium-dependent haloperoxidase [Nucisporomicrobium flavum]